MVVREWKSQVLTMDRFTSSTSTSLCTEISEPTSQVFHRISRALDLSSSLIDGSEAHPTISGLAKVLDELQQIVRSVQTD